MTLRRIMLRSWKEFDWNRPFDQFLCGMSALSAKTAQTEAHLAAASAGNQLARRLLVSEKTNANYPQLVQCQPRTSFGSMDKSKTTDI